MFPNIISKVLLAAAIATAVMARPHDMAEQQRFGTCDDKRKYDPYCQCELGNFFKNLVCPILPTCKECDIPCNICD